MKILFISTENPFPVDHGHHLRTYYMLKALASEHTIHFVGFSQDEDGIKNKKKLFEFCETVDIFKLRYNGWRQLLLAFANIFTSFPLVAQKYFDLHAAARLQELVRTAGIDLVHFDMLHLARYRDCIGDLPAVLVNHNVESVRLQRWAKLERKPLVRAYLFYQYPKLRAFERSACARFDRCIAVSHEDKLALQELCPGARFETIPNGSDVEYFRPDETPAEEDTLVWAGSMLSPYNRDGVNYFLTEIWPIISSRRSQVKAVFVGKVPEQLRQVSVNDSRVSFTGYLEDVRDTIAKGAIFIAPIRSGSGTKIKILNAMAQGKPVVTTTIGAEGIEATSDEIAVADEPELFARKVIDLLGNPTEARRMGQRARKLVEAKYDWQIINKKISRVYASVGGMTESVAENAAVVL